MPSPELKTGVVLLAAGRGKRFGGGKLMAEFRGRPLWERAARTAEAIEFSERVVVIEPDSPIGSRLGWVRVENQFAMQGMGTSIAAGVRALTDCGRVIIMLADMPLVSRSHLDRLIAAQGVGFTRYLDGSAGCPAIFPRSVFPLLETLVSVVRTFGTLCGVIVRRIGLVWLVDVTRRAYGVASADIRWSVV